MMTFCDVLFYCSKGIYNPVMYQYNQWMISYKSKNDHI